MQKTIIAIVAVALVASPAQAQQDQRYVTVTLGDTMVVEIDEDIMTGIRNRAAEEWPEDYAMQEYVAERQVAAVLWLSEWVKSPPVKQQVAERIYNQAASEWPEDYTMQQYAIERQVEAYLAMQ